ncbi:MAG TPA: hypothetical protein VF188_07235 [Longimicrobiales bacterium]
MPANTHLAEPAAPPRVAFPFLIEACAPFLENPVLFAACAAAVVALDP